MRRHHHRPQPSRNAIIRNLRSGLVLDASDYVVKIQHFNRTPFQLWKFEEFSPGRYIIVNQGNGKVLDIEEGAKIGHKLITFPRHGRENQQWFFNADNTISCVGGGLAVDICKEYYSPGNHLIAFSNHGGDNQKFRVEYL